MYDRFLVPYYFYWPIGVIGFILAFFLPTSPDIELLNNKYNLSIYYNETNNNDNNLSLIFNNTNENITEDCKNILIDINNQQEIKILKKLNLAIKIILIILFGFTCLNIGFVIFMVMSGNCYDDDVGGYCQTWEQTFSLNDKDDPDMGKAPFIVYSIFIVICLGIIIISICSLYFSLEFKNKMSNYCQFELGKDYNFRFFMVSIAFLIIIAILYLLQTILCAYSICYAIFVVKKGN